MRARIRSRMKRTCTCAARWCPAVFLLQFGGCISQDTVLAALADSLSLSLAAAAQTIVAGAVGPVVGG